MLGNTIIPFLRKSFFAQLLLFSARPQMITWWIENGTSCWEQVFHEQMLKIASSTIYTYRQFKNKYFSLTLTSFKFENAEKLWKWFNFKVFDLP